MTTLGSRNLANRAWGWARGLALTILRQEEFRLVPTCRGEFCSCIQCGIFVCCYDELLPQAQITSFCPQGVWLGSCFIVQVRVYGLPSSFSVHMFAELCLVAFCSIVEAGSMVRVSCLEGCGNQFSIGLFLIRCFYFCFINDILGSTFFR